MKWSNYSLEDLYDVVSDFTNKTIRFREVLTSGEVLERFKEAEEAKANKES